MASTEKGSAERGALHRHAPELQRGGIFPRHRAPRAGEPLAIFAVEGIRVFKVHLRIRQRRIVEVRELEDEAPMNSALVWRMSWL